MSKHILLALPLVGALAVAAAPAASAQTATDAAVSGNWAGYVAGDDATGFSSVSGSWVQPSAKCGSGQTDSAYWVGLGGASGSSDALEQTGTEANCSADGSVSNYAWYELVPAAPVKLPVAIHAGDHITGRVTVNGTAVTVTIDDTTTGQSSTKALTMQDPDTSTAEWIAEAPSVCAGGAASGDCQALPLADFGTVGFSSATATAGGHTGTINDSAWQAEPIELDPEANGTMYPGGLSTEISGYGGSSSTAGAVPSTLSSDGSSFTVSYNASADSGSSTGGYGSSTGGYGGASSGYGSADPYGYGSGDPYGYGNPYGSSGYGGYGSYDPYGNPYAYSYGDGYSAYGYGQLYALIGD